MLPHGSGNGSAHQPHLHRRAARTDDLCLDMATSIIAWNVVANAARAGTRIPRGWAVDPHGRGTTDPRRARALLPAGAYKGSGLGLMIEVLCALLSGAPYGPDVPRMYEQLDEHRRLGGLVGAIQVRPFVPVRVFGNALVNCWRGGTDCRHQARRACASGPARN
jgi:LDH2 family malate/lactate/ureidoglycolate dehydrogenase